MQIKEAILILIRALISEPHSQIDLNKAGASLVRTTPLEAQRQSS